MLAVFAAHGYVIASQSLPDVGFDFFRTEHLLI
jgi:hypothetical protein